MKIHFFRVKPIEKQRIIKEISKEFQRNVKGKPMENWFQSLWNFWVFMLTFHVVPSRVLLGWLRATARWKVEARSCPTRCWNPLSDRYTHSYDLYCPEKEMHAFLKKAVIFAGKWRKTAIYWAKFMKSNSNFRNTNPIMIFGGFSSLEGRVSTPTRSPGPDTSFMMFIKKEKFKISESKILP